MGWTRNVQNGLFRIELRGKIVVTIQTCTIDDCEYLAELNKELIHAESSDNPMTIKELEQRMKDFLQTFYEAYFFIERDRVVGYALIKMDCEPLYLRQFFDYSGIQTEALWRTGISDVINLLKNGFC